VIYEGTAKLWLQADKNYVLNVVSAAILRPLWLTRNDFIFNKPVWRDQKMILAKAISLLRGEPRMQELKSSWK
jgi:hypothetical protein